MTQPFSATVDLLDANALAVDILAAANAQVRDKRRELLNRIMERAKTLYRATTQFWEGGGREPQITPGYVKKKVPTPEFKTPAPIEMGDQIVQSIGTDNWLWIQLDKGIKRTATGGRDGSGEYYVPMKARTVPGVLVNHPSQGSYSNELHRMPPGTPITVAPRKWNDTIAEKLRDEFGPVASRQGLELTVTVTE